MNPILKDRETEETKSLGDLFSPFKSYPSSTGVPSWTNQFIMAHFIFTHFDYIKPNWALVKISPTLYTFIKRQISKIWFVKQLSRRWIGITEKNPRKREFSKVRHLPSEDWKKRLKLSFFRWEKRGLSLHIGDKIDSSFKRKTKLRVLFRSGYFEITGLIWYEPGQLGVLGCKRYA